MAWAPISAVLVHLMYGRAGMTTLALFEELLPFTDIVPTATLAWWLEHRDIVAGWDRATQIAD